MEGWSSLGKMLVYAGLGLAGLGLLILLGGKVFPFGRLPGDIYYQKGNFTFYFPLVSMLLLSLFLTVVLNLFFRR